jgi:hypothetical protein
MKNGVFILIICILLFFTSGCLEEIRTDSNTPADSPTFSLPKASLDIQPSIAVSILDGPEKRNRPDETCYWETRIESVNIADSDAYNVVIHCAFIDGKTGEIQIKNEHYRRFNAGERKIFVKIFDGICDHTYYMEFEADYDIS